MNLFSQPNIIDDVTRALPHAVQPEKSVLSSILQDPEEYFDLAIQMGLTESHFYLPNNAALFAVIFKMHAEGKQIELVGLVQSLLDVGKLEKCGGAAYIADIYSYAPNPMHFRSHLQMIKDKQLLRSIIRTANESVANAYENPDDPAGVLAEMESAVMSIREDGSTPELSTMEISKQFMDRFERLCKGETSPVGIRTGIFELDNALKGLQPRQLGIISARPSGGKSTLATQIFSHIGASGIAVGYFPLEGTVDAAYVRCVIQLSKLVSRAVTDPILHAQMSGRANLSKEESAAIMAAIKTLALGKFVFDPPKSPDISSVIASIRRAHRKHGIQVAFVDYIQLISAKGLRSKEEETSHISKSLLRTGVELGISMVVMSQENEEGETKHARAIEEDADWWLQVVQHQDRKKDNYKQHRYCLIAKDRHHGKGGFRLPLILDAETVRFIRGEEEKTSSVSNKPNF